MLKDIDQALRDAEAVVGEFSLKLLNIDVHVAMNDYAPKLRTLQRIRADLKDIDSTSRS